MASSTNTQKARSSPAMASLARSLCFLLLCLSTTASPSPDLLFSPSYFLSNHALMLSSFKVFIYPPIPGYGDSDLRSLLAQPPAPQDASEAFFSSLSSSEFVTLDANAAHLFFIPVSLGAVEKNASVSIGRALKDLVQELRDRYPYWQRTLGADHFLAGCRRFKPADARNVLELQKNSIWLACAELFGGEDGASESGDGLVDPQFFPHKDLTMPPYRAPPIDWPEDSDNRDDHDRPNLVYVISYPNSSASQQWEQDPDFVFGSEDYQSAAYWENLSNSKFCLSFASVGHRRSVVDGMRQGCVPVIVSNGYLQGLPFQDILDWQRFSVIASSKQLHKLKKYLSAVPEAKYSELQLAAKAASAHFEWHHPPRPYDSFHILMYELWLRRHTIRYGRRDIQ